MRFKHGFTLLETLMVLAIASIVILFGINHYRQYQQKQQLIAISHNIHSLQQAFNAYYQKHCETNELKNFNPTLNDVMNEEKVTLAKTPLVGQYQIKAHYLGSTKKSQKDIYQLIVKATINVPFNALSWYRQKLNATSITLPNTLQWVTLPSYPTTATDSGLWVLDAGLRDFKEKIFTENQGNVELPEDKSCAY